jgi:hypothetical protein
MFKRGGAPLPSTMKEEYVAKEFQSPHLALSAKAVSIQTTHALNLRIYKKQISNRHFQLKFIRYAKSTAILAALTIELLCHPGFKYMHKRVRIGFFVDKIYQLLKFDIDRKHYVFSKCRSFIGNKRQYRLGNNID